MEHLKKVLVVAIVAYAVLAVSTRVDVLKRGAGLAG